MSPSPVYLPGNPREGFAPLARYLPPIPGEVASTWIADRTLQGKFILDPFGADPNLSVEAAQSGGRLIVAANNPIMQLLIEITAQPPTPTEIRTVFASLAASRIRDERLEPHISALYQSNCPNCHQPLTAQAFIWERQAQRPHAKIIACSACDTAGEFPTRESDWQQAAQFKSGGLHQARALERVARLNDPDRHHVEAALDVYPPRAVYALLTLVNKLDALNLSAIQEKILAVLLLQAFDQANTLWPHPVERERPRQLTIPPVYRENNIWLALEEAAQEWIAAEQAVPITYWPELPPEAGGICIFEGRIRDLAAQLSGIDLAAVLTAFPRPNQAFWSLSALWAGWLWGPEAVEHFKSVLRRRRYDWGWHTSATQHAIESLRPALTDEPPVLGLIGEAEPGFVAAVTLAAAQSGWQLEGLALSEKNQQAQIQWQSKPAAETPINEAVPISEMLLQAARRYLLARGEPCGYLPLFSALMVAAAQQHAFPEDNSPPENYSALQQEIQATLNYRQGFLRYGGSEKSLEVGYWWLREAQDAAEPLTDRVEIAAVQALIAYPNSQRETLMAAIYQEFPGLMTPSRALVCECLESYGEEVQGGWHIREQDAPSKRRAELADMGELIRNLGEKLGFSVQALEGDAPQYLWSDTTNNPKFAFFVSASGLLGKFLVTENVSPAQSIIVLPGGRANLVMFKLRNDPRLQQIAEQGWLFLKYRQARQLANSPSLTAENLEAQLGLDPLTYAETQLRMF